MSTWLEEQQHLKTQLILQDGFDIDHIKAVGGFDISYVVGDTEHACAAFVVLEYPSMQILYHDCQPVLMTEPYIAGFLAFREVKHLMALYNIFLKSFGTGHHISPPQVSLVDGNGILHHHQFGLASHLGVLLGIPTIGVGKSLLQVDGLTKQIVASEFKNALEKGDWKSKMIGESGFFYGYAMQSNAECTNPIFVSPGHLVSHETSIEIVRNCIKHRVPEPVRHADMLSREWNRKHAILQHDKVMP